MINLFPLDEHDLPSYRTSLGFFTGFGAATVILANLIHNHPFYHRTVNWLIGQFMLFVEHAILGPWGIVVGAGLGLLGGHVLHTESTRAWQQLKLQDDYRARLAYQYKRDHGILDKE